jgi:hypothetical protein
MLACNINPSGFVKIYFTCSIIFVADFDVSMEGRKYILTCPTTIT